MTETGGLLLSTILKSIVEDKIITRLESNSVTQNFSLYFGL